MTDFKDRETAFEAKFARDEEMQFRVTARRNRLLGQWAAEKMGLTSEETDAYAKEVVAADFEEAGDEDVIRKLLGDLTSAGVEMDDAGMAGDGDHYAAKVTSAAFADMNRVKQHQAVYAALKGKMGGELHALQLTTAVPD